MMNVHASALTKPDGFCPRSYALADVTGIKPQDEWLTTSEMMTFQIGRDQEKNIVLWFADMGKAICHWKCLGCGSIALLSGAAREMRRMRPRKLYPQEVRFESALTGASCGVDMLLALGGTKLRVHEIKTMDKDKFSELKAPLAEHRWRTNFYLRIIAETDHHGPR